MHTGPVVIADAGEVFGETANVAARVQGAAEPDTVVITAATQRLVAGLFVVEERGAQHLKGVREPVTLYRVVQPSGVRSRLAVAAGHLTRFVGRDMELGTPVDRWERAQDGERQNVIVEDLHWCDVSTLELLGHLIAQSPTARVLLLATARPGFTPPWPARSNLTTVQLARLTKRQAREMVEHTIAQQRTIRHSREEPAPAKAWGGNPGGGRGGPQSEWTPAFAGVTEAEFSNDVINALVARADGVPLYVEELTKAMAEPGAARGVEAIPASLADSLMERLDRLSRARRV